MSGARVVFAPGAPTVRGASSADLATVSFTLTPRSYPEFFYDEARQEADYIWRVPAYSTPGEPTLSVSGNTDLLNLSVAPTYGGDKAFRLNGLDAVYSGSSLNDAELAVKASNRFGSQLFRYTFTPAPEATYYPAGVYSVRHKPGTFVGHLYDTLLPLLPAGGATNETNCQFLAGGTYNVGNVQVQPNPTFFLKDIDWSGIALARTGTGYALPVELISPRHGVMAAHTDGSMVGDQVTFRRPDGSTQTVTVLANARYVTESDNTSPDVSLVYFDAPVTGCAIFKIPSATCADVSPKYEADGTPYRFYTPSYWPVVVRVSNPGNGALVLDRDSPSFITMSALPPTTSFRLTNLNIPPFDPLVAGHYRSVYSGDSGSPTFALVREGASTTPTPVLLSTLHAVASGMTVPYGFGPNFGALSAWLEENMTALATANGDTTTYAPRYIDLSRFTKFA